VKTPGATVPTVRLNGVDVAPGVSTVNGTLVPVTVPVKPPDELPVTLHVPAVVVERIVPCVVSAVLWPAEMTTDDDVSVQTEDGEALSAMVMSLAAVVLDPLLSTKIAVMLVVDVPSSAIVLWIGFRSTCAPTAGVPVGVGVGLGVGVGVGVGDGVGDEVLAHVTLTE